MHILFIIPSLGRGGAEINTLKLTDHFLSLDYEVTILLTSDNCEIINQFNPRTNFLILGNQTLVQSLKEIGSAVSKVNPNVIFANLWPLTFLTSISLIFSPRYLRKLVIIEHIDLRVALNSCSYFERILENIFHFIAPFFVKYIVGVSPGVLKSVKKSSFILPNKFKFIANPIYKSSEYRVPTKVKNFIEIPSPLRILAVGNLKPQKDYPTMLRVIRYLRDQNYNPQLTIAGDGQLRPFIEQLILTYSLGSNVKLLGSVKDVFKLFDINDIYLMTSSWEGFGNSLAEALVAGCRCVSTNCRSGPSYILGNGKFGTLANTRDFKSISEAIITELMIKRVPNDFNESITRFSVERIGKLYEELIL